MSDIRGRFPVALGGVLALAVTAASMIGCDPPARGGLVVATSWPLAERLRLQAELQKWEASSRLDSGLEPIRLQWLILEPGADGERLSRRRDAPAVLLGGSVRALERLARERLLIPVEDGSAVRWGVARRPTKSPAGFRDPRSDSVTLEWAMKQLAPGSWREGYAQLVRAAGNLPRIGGQGGGEQPARAEIDVPGSLQSAGAEGVGIFQSATDMAMAREFLRFLVETRQVELAPPRTGDAAAAEPEVESLVADLLGATLVDAQDELWTAWRSLERAGSPDPARQWLTEPPPWPPASIEKYLRREGENAMSLIETLAAELSPLPAARGWLIRSWLSPPRIVDMAMLTEMATAAEGTVGREQRFRAWLRAEWTAWARQRYRRVTRLAAKPPEPGQFAR